MELTHSEKIKRIWKNPEHYKKAVARFKSIIHKKTCECCKKEFSSHTYNAKICKVCAPTRTAYLIYRKYNLNKSQHESMIATNNGMCWICLERKAVKVDHCHKTGRVRGLLCTRCNTNLTMIENKELLKRAKKYLSNSNYSVKHEQSL